MGGVMGKMLLRAFDRVCNALWWVPGVLRLWAAVANRTLSPWPARPDQPLAREEWHLSRHKFDPVPRRDESGIDENECSRCTAGREAHVPPYNDDD